ncbi:hypothetical protein AAMO2058_001021000, partial [Amorphochlora amoebiformis]
MVTVGALVVLLSGLPSISAASGPDSTPSFRWSQDEETLYLNIEVQCDEKSIDIATDVDFFGFSCVGADGVKKTLSFTPREDIVPNAVNCERKAGTFESCSIKKRHRHFFDRLWATDEGGLLASKAQVDWKAMKTEDASDDSDIYSTRHIKTLTATKLKKLRAKSKPIILDVSFPWCTKCNNARLQLEQAAKKLHKKAHFAFIDAREERQIGRDFDADCTHVCEFHVRAAGENNFTTIKVSDEGTSIGLIGKLKKYIRPLITKVKSRKAVSKLNLKCKIVIVTDYRDSDDEYDKIKAVARANRELCFAAIPPSENPGNAHVFAVTGAKKKSLRMHPYPDLLPLEEKNILIWSKRLLLPAYTSFTVDLKDTLVEANVPCAR